ncbi:MAG: hypothetical protein LBQ94_02595 [Treponema sp.]|nr:hypothetical protein [Treponema sp.]
MTDTTLMIKKNHGVFSSSVFREPKVRRVSSPCTSVVKFLLFFSLLFSFFTFQLHAQSADWIESLLASDRVTYADAALLVLEAADALAAPNPAAAFGYAAERGWLPKGAAADDAARLDGLSLLVMRAFDFKGGLFYTLTKSPHHAYRELTYRNIIQGRADPMMPVSGDLLLFTVNRILTLNGE